MPCPYCGASLADGARLCTACGRLIAPRPPGQPPGATPSSDSRPVYLPDASYDADPYGPAFDPASLTPDTAAAWRQHRYHATFSVLLLILVHFLTFGTASPFLLARKYAFLPSVRRDDFGTAKAAGFLFIPFFGLYWVFIMTRRIADRLTLQARLWDLPGAPSTGLASTLAICWVLTAIPYLGLLFWFPLHLALWPVYLWQIQRFCNRLALEAAPLELRPAMVTLERAMRLRWIGWIIVFPCVLLVVTSLVVMMIEPVAPISATIVGVGFFLAITAGGAVLVYLGERGTREIHARLASSAPAILAGYLRIDKNAAWTLVWIAVPMSVVCVAAGTAGLTDPSAAGIEPRQALPSVVLGVVIGIGAGYALLRALQLKAEIGRLTETRPISAGSESAGW